MKRIYPYVAMAFVASFAGVSWAARGFPVGIGAWQTVFATGDHGVRDDQDKKRENERIMRSLDTIKNEALQAATGFALSPCDSTMKQNLVEALTAYVHAWQIKLDCPRLANMPIVCSQEKLKAAVATFSTPLDQRVTDAVAQAFDQPGITIADFPESIRYDMLRFGGPALRPGYLPACQTQAPVYRTTRASRPAQTPTANR
ncbi:MULTISPECIES: hypothetical protein [Bradyrhizobium]|uniref:Uncharacterized protein n=2 Tax=Bradyrhizobium TaxID=374 RepID=A0ABY0PG64_9BRAD|nr:MULTISPECIES: hypothetical protein [Bradyrhizobium]SDI31325.1 hypothetical protein SAMN05444163_2470 [Bradyrhizobium ottawaense]SED65005.1 hypothetical protein SAMN05444171_4698 [Bradyrhizobium lablabi]SHL61444.1 hypothetical protein SAMN05444321_3514 [Bradyrhizobium lablabi]